MSNRHAPSLAGPRRPATSRLARLAALCMVAVAPALAATELRIAWIEERPGGTILTPTGLLAFHGGELDFFDLDRPAPALLQQALPELMVQRVRPLVFELRDQYPEADFRGFVAAPPGPQIGTPPPLWPSYRYASLTVDPHQHRYLSFLLPVQPSNDAFAGNEDPLRHRLFDDDGRFLGPFHIDVYGSDVFDAGLCDNSESQLAWLDWAPGSGRQPCTGGEGLVRRHPGLNGSLRNPDGAPVGVLGASSSFSDDYPLDFDTVAADFTRPGQRLGRLIVSSGTSWFGASGSWYSPERSGEGFSLQVLPPEAPGGPSRALVYWYTYAPDDSGRQVWLTGLGAIGSASPYRLPTATIPLHRTQGGGFASTGNPQDVVATPWGTLTLTFTGCDRATVGYQAGEAGYGSGGFQVDRLGPPVEGLDWLCDPADPWLPPPPPTP